MMPRVAVGVPSGRTWEAEMAISLISLMGASNAIDTTLLWQFGSHISFQRNEIVRHAFEESSITHLFWWDSDMVFPPSALIELLGHHKQIVGAVYCKKIAPFEMIGKLGHADGRLKPAEYLPGGCMLVSMDVYRKIGWPYYFEKIVQPSLTWKTGTLTSEDYSFCEKARANGFEIWCDINLSQRIKHIGQQSVQMQLKIGHPDRVENVDV